MDRAIVILHDEGLAILFGLISEAAQAFGRWLKGKPKPSEEQNGDEPLDDESAAPDYE